MGTSSTSGWAVFWFLIGFTVIGTAAIGTGVVGFLAGVAIVAYSGFLFMKAKTQEAL